MTTASININDPLLATGALFACTALWCTSLLQWDKAFRRPKHKRDLDIVFEHVLGERSLDFDNDILNALIAARSRGMNRV